VAERDQPSTPAGKALKRLPWLLAGGSAVTLVARLAVGGSDDGLSVPAIILIMATTAAAILLWARRLDRQADEAGRDVGALFSCSTTLQYQLLREQPRLREVLKPVRLSWLVGGWLIGKLFVGSDGVTFRPNAWTRATFRVPTVVLPWSEIDYAAAVDQPGPRDPGLLELHTTDDRLHGHQESQA